MIQSVLRANREVLDQALPSFRRSVDKCRSLIIFEPRSFEVEESFDALTSKFARVADIFTQKVLKSLVLSGTSPLVPAGQLTAMKTYGNL